MTWNFRLDLKDLILAGMVGVMPTAGPAQEAVNSVSPPFAIFDLASEPVLRDPHDLTIGPDGRLYVADKLANRIAIFDRETLELVGSFGAGDLFNPRDIDFGPDGRAVVADTGNSRVAIYEIAGDTAILVGSLGGASRTEGAAAHPNGRIYATASGLGALIAYENGKPVATATGLSGAHDVDVDRDGNLLVADMGHRRIVKYAPDLTVLSVIEGPDYGFVGPRYLATDELGRIVVADQDAHRMLLIEADGALVGTIGDGRPGEGPNMFDDPEGAAIDGSAFYFSDSDNNRVVRYRVVMN